MGRLTLNLLGMPEILHAGQAVSFRTRKALALLVYLAVEGMDGTPMHTREKLSTFFWPASDRKAGRATLRSTLLYLRNGLAHASDDTHAESHLIVERDALGFNLDSAYDLDVEILDDVATTTDKDRLNAMMARCRGEFLDGFSLPDSPAFDDWMTFQREKWHRRMNAVFDRLSRLQAEHGDYVQAIETARQWNEIEPYDERAYRRLMRFQFTAGNRVAALQAYERCRDMLDAEFDASPAPETEALAERIRQEGPSEQGTSRKLESERSFLLSELPFLGRATEHAALARSFYAARDGTAQVGVIVGEAGIGKTRLAHEFLAWTRANDADIIRGRSFESGGRLPYQPVVDALRYRIDRENAPDDLLSDVWLAEVSRLLPELHDRYPDLQPPRTDDSTTQTRMFEAVSRLCIALAKRRPLVVFIDDLQWADLASLDLLQYTARRWREAEASIFLLTTLRAEALAGVRSRTTAVPLREWLAGLERDVPFTRLSLTPLSEEETRTLIEILAGAQRQGSSGAGEQERKPVKRTLAPQHTSPSAPRHPGSLAQFAEWLYAETQGRPFFINEALNALLEDGVLRVQRDGAGQPRLALEERGAAWTPPKTLITPGIQEVICSRLSNLDADAFDLLAAGAVLGHDFTSDALWNVADVSPAAGLRALDHLLAGRLLVETNETENGTPPSYSFTHDRIRDVTYTEAGDARRHLFHNRALAYLVAQDAAPAQLAHHARAAGQPEAIFRYSVDAGDEAMKLYAVRDAIEYYDTARRACSEHPGLADQIAVSRRRHLYDRLGRAYELVNEWEKARTVYREMRAVAQQANLPHLEVAALNNLADLIMQQRVDVESARELLSRASCLAEETEDRTGLARAKWCLARVARYNLEEEQAIAHGERALMLARDVGDTELIARSLSELSYAKHGAMPLSVLREAEEHAREAAALFARLGNRAMEVDSLVMVVAVKIHAGRPHEAEDVAREAHEIAIEIDNDWGQVNIGFNLAQTLFECGRWGEALETIERALTIAEDPGRMPAPMLGGILEVRGSFYAAFMDHEQARSDQERAHALFKNVPNPSISHVTALDMCATCVAAEEWAGAYRYAQDALRIEGSTWLFSSFRYWCIVEALLHEGEVERARAVVEDFGERIGDNPRYAIPYRRARVLLAQRDEDILSAARHLEAAVDAATEIGLPGELWQLYAELGAIYTDAGDTTRAVTVRARAEEIVQQLAGTLPEQDLRSHFLAAARKRIFSDGADT